MSHFEVDVGPLGSVDFLHAKREYTLAMLKRVKPCSMFSGVVELPIIITEDSIGLKVQSSTNDPNRYYQDMADIRELIKRNRSSLNMSLIEEYFDLFDRLDDLKTLLKKVDHDLK